MNRKRSFLLPGSMELALCVVVVQPAAAAAAPDRNQRRAATRPRPTARSTRPPKSASDTRKSKATTEAKKHYAAAQRAYRQGRFCNAAPEFVSAYRIIPDPGLAYNAADSYERAGRYASAVHFYEEYLRLSPKANDRRQVEAKLKTLRAKVAANPSATTPASGNRSRASAKAPLAPTRTTASATAMAGTSSASSRPGATKKIQTTRLQPLGTNEQTKPATAATHQPKGKPELAPAALSMPPSRQKTVRRPMNTAAWAMLGATALLLTVTGICALKIQDAEDNMRRLAIYVDPDTNTRLTYEGAFKSDFERYERQGKLFEKLTWGFAAASGAAAVAAAILFTVDHFRHRKHPKEKLSIRITPILDTHSGGVAVGGAF